MGGRGHSVRLPVLAHPALPISCLPKNTQLHLPLQLKILLSQAKQAAAETKHSAQPAHISCQALPGVFV